MSIYTDKERVITNDQRSCQFLHFSYIDITLIIPAVPSGAVLLLSLLLLLVVMVIGLSGVQFRE